ncbi:hypothetical protein NQU47_01510 [Pseudoalteromonas distincta]|uniref:hypothetical protein n=1 Tax=Pseudoalteromonas distincta TaxID=77608 RepID=UPI002340122F|nr:hypothetical protein [Pseudoalteromonas distincta]MDC3211230.1 hypothetical protein [Pseudoalteromonas distincta]
MKNKLITLLIAGPLISSSFFSMASEVPTKESFNKRCMDAWQSIKAGDREALFAELPPKLQNWNEGKTAWKQVDKAIKNYKEDWEQLNLNNLKITLLDTAGEDPNGNELVSGLQSSVDKRMARFYPEATREFTLFYTFINKERNGSKSCSFLEFDNEWYMYHRLL